MVLESEHSLLLLRSLYILSVLHITAFLKNFAPFRPSNSDFGYIEERESTAGYTFTPVWDLLLSLA
jgi:hypothetical protein